MPEENAPGLADRQQPVACTGSIFNWINYLSSNFGMDFSGSLAGNTRAITQERVSTGRRKRDRASND
jgi:hypothetical protein